MTYPSGRVVNYQHNTQGRLSEVSTSQGNDEQLVANGFESMPFGAYSGFVYGNGSEVNVLRDLNFRITDIRINSQSQNDTLYNVGFAYDKVSNITAISDYTAPTRNQQFTYDESSRLVQASGHYGDMRYDYDGVGNRLSREISRPTQGEIEPEIQQESYTYAQDSNRLLSVASTTNNGTAKQRDLTYDAVGNIVQDGKTKAEKTLQYSARNRLKQVDLNESDDTVIYRYNVKGERISKQVKGVTTHFHYDLSGRMIAENVVESQSTDYYHEFIYGAGQHLATVGAKVSEPQAINFVVTDQLGTPQMLLDSLEQVVWQRDASPFGEVALANITSEQLFGFPGQYHDVDTGYAYNYFRDYDASLGRYIQSDPIGLGGGVNTFGYTSGNPIIYKDPRGLHFYNERQAQSAARSRTEGLANYERAPAASLIYYNSSRKWTEYFSHPGKYGENYWEISQPSINTADANNRYAFYTENSIDANGPHVLGEQLKSAIIAFPKNSVSDTKAQLLAQKMANTIGAPVEWNNSGQGSGLVSPSDCD